LAFPFGPTASISGNTRLVNVLLSEREGAIAAASFLPPLHDEEGGEFPKILADAYRRMPAASDLWPSPAPATYLGLQWRNNFDIVQFEASGNPDTALIFLHGFGGNFYIYCWELAQAAGQAAISTFCPSTDPNGYWWTPKGQTIVGATLSRLRDKGYRRFYLAGLSNGAAGASVIINNSPEDFDGVILISGAQAALPPNKPALIVQGKRDQMMTTSFVREIAQSSPLATYRETEGGHLIFLSRHQEVRTLIAEWLKAAKRDAGSF
jgi:pimeloyl-ACP methyl ester carboxylesterase